MEYADFLKSLEPVFLGLDGSSCSLNRTAFWAMDASARRVLSSTYRLADFDDDYFDVEASFAVSIQWSNDDGPVTQALKIDCVFIGHFHSSKQIDLENARRFAETESWLIFWPFFRQFISDTSARMAIPPITVPLALGPGEHAYRLSSASNKKKAKHLKSAKK